MPHLDDVEYLALMVARRLHDGDLGFLGVASGVHRLAFEVAKATTCPNLGYVERGGRYSPGRLTVTGAERTGPAPVFECDMTAMVDLVDWRADFFDVAMLGGIQIDKHGNTNMIAVGAYETPQFRGPGTIGAAALAALVHETHLVAERHDARTLVDSVDYCSGFGHKYGGRSRAEVGLPTVGPVCLHTPLATFDFEEGVARLAEVVGELTLTDIQERTGFEVRPASAGVRQVPPASPGELEALCHISQRGKGGTGGA